MGTAFWIRRFLLVFTGAFALIAASHLVRGRAIEHALAEAVLWATLTAAVFTGARIVQSRRGQHCAVCRDTPEFHETQR
jgi:hypothetical protein